MVVMVDYSEIGFPEMAHYDFSVTQFPDSPPLGADCVIEGLPHADTFAFEIKIILWI
jgi:hypothetical protein